METPSAVKVLGYEYPVEMVERIDDDDTCRGMCYNVELRIKLCSTLPEQALRSTLLHEVIEALDSQLILHLPHDTIQRLEAGLNQVMVDNPDLLKMYLEDA